MNGGRQERIRPQEDRRVGHGRGGGGGRGDRGFPSRKESVYSVQFSIVGIAVLWESRFWEWLGSPGLQEKAF